MQLICAARILPPEGPPIDGGALVVDGDRICDLGSPQELARRWPVRRKTELPDCVLLPALVNAHAHLELSGLPVPLFDADFTTWLMRVIESKRDVAEGAWAEGVRIGAAACLRNGQTTVADVCSQPAAAAAYPEKGLRVCTFPEVIAPRGGALHAGLQRAREVVAAVRGNAEVAGLSPHAPYTVCADALQRCREVAAQRGWRLMVHLAESAAEVAFCQFGNGDIVDKLYAGLPAAPPQTAGCHPVDWLSRQGVLGAKTILIHVVHLGAREVGTLAESGTSVVLCPRSNRNLGVGVAPGRALLDAGVPVGLGTDSVLSAADLDLWADAAAAVEDYGWRPREALAAASAGSAACLGLGEEVGGVRPGMRADLVAVRCVPGGDPWEAVLAESRVARVWLGGVELPATV